MRVVSAGRWNRRLGWAWLVGGFAARVGTGRGRGLVRRERTQLPGPMRRTQAPCKRRVFGLLAQTIRNRDAE